MARRIGQQGVEKRLKALGVLQGTKRLEKANKTVYELHKLEKHLQLTISDEELRAGTTKWGDVLEVINRCFIKEEQ